MEQQPEPPQQRAAAPAGQGLVIHDRSAEFHAEASVAGPLAVRKGKVRLTSSPPVAALRNSKRCTARPQRLRARRKKEWGRVEASEPNQIWQSDMTKIWAGPGVG